MSMANNAQLFIVVGVIGATVMPHALVAHSWLTKNKLTSGDEAEKKRLLRYHKWDTIMNMSNASYVNLTIMAMAAAAFYFHGFTNVATIDDAYKTLIPLFGVAASVVFAITLFVRMVFINDECDVGATHLRRPPRTRLPDPRNEVQPLGAEDPHSGSKHRPN